MVDANQISMRFKFSREGPVSLSVEKGFLQLLAFPSQLNWTAAALRKHCSQNAPGRVFYRDFANYSNVHHLLVMLRFRFACLSFLSMTKGTLVSGLLSSLNLCLRLPSHVNCAK